MEATRYQTTSPEETTALGAELARELPKGAFVALYGDLGVGKTAFVRGMASVLAPDAYVQSPTYAMIHEYHGKDGVFCHMDMYRISSEEDLESIGFYDYEGCTLAVEWCEKIPYALPDTYYSVQIQKCEQDPNMREVLISQITR